MLPHAKARNYSFLVAWLLAFFLVAAKKHEITEKGKKAQSQQQEIIKRKNKGSN
jgi:hypothetical protein